MLWSGAKRIGRRLAGNWRRHRCRRGEGIETIERNARRRERRHKVREPRQDARIDDTVSMPVVPSILTCGRKILRRRTAMMRFSGMLVQLVVGMPVPERQRGCAERHHQTGE